MSTLIDADDEAADNERASHNRKPTRCGRSPRLALICILERADHQVRPSARGAANA